jgi:hypothetical protein
MPTLAELETINKKLEEEHKQYRANLVRIRKAAKRVELEIVDNHKLASLNLRKELIEWFNDYLHSNQYSLHAYVDNKPYIVLNNLTLIEIKRLENITAKEVTVRLVGEKLDQPFMTWSTVDPITGSTFKRRAWFFGSSNFKLKFRHLVY